MSLSSSTTQLFLQYIAPLRVYGPSRARHLNGSSPCLIIVFAHSQHDLLQWTKHLMQEPLPPRRFSSISRTANVGPSPPMQGTLPPACYPSIATDACNVIKHH